MRLWLFVALAACGDGAKVIFIDAAGPQLSLDVVATPTHIWLRTNDTDIPSCEFVDNSAQFATYDACIAIGDVRCRGSSCLTTRLTGTGVMQPNPPIVDPLLGFQVPSPFPPDLTLELSGCGHPSVEIPIEPFVAPTPTLNVAVNGNVITATWETDIPAQSAYAKLITSVWLQECHPLTNEQSFTAYTPEAPPYFTVDVTTFLPYTTTHAELGEIRLWRGNSTSMFWQMP